MGLTDLERAVLDFAGRTYRYPGARETDVLEEFGWSAVRHAQVELALIDRVEAWEYAPVVVKRLRARRESRKSARVRRDSAVHGVPTRGSGGSETFPF